MSEPRVIIAGSRSFTDYALLASTLDGLRKGERWTIISGGARGADQLGELYAVRNNLELQILKADWEREGKAAGYRRNERMANYGTHLVAFWDGESPGTRHMINIARARGLKVKVITL